MATQYPKFAPEGSAESAPRIPFSALEHFLNSSPAISGPAGPITHRMSGWFPGMRVGGVVVPDPNLVAEVTGALETSAGTLIPNPSVAPEDNILPIPSVDDSAPSEVDIFAGGAIPSVLPGGGVSEQPLPCGAPELHDPSYMSGISGVCPAWPVAKDAELPPYISDMKDFDMVKAFTPNTLVASQTPEAVGLWEVPEGAPITSVNTVFENTGLPTPIHPPILATVSVEQEETINSASPLSLVENLDRPSSPGALPVELESTGCNGEWAAFAGTPTEENQERTTSSSTENCQPINPIGASIEVDEAEIKSTSHINPNPISQSKPPSTDELAGADGGAIKFSFKKDSAIGATFGSDAEPPLESDACHTVLELVVQEPASPKHFLDGHQLHIPLPINHNSNFASPTKFLPGAPKANTADLRNEDSNSSGSVRPQAGHGEVGTPGTRESSSEDTATISAVIEGDSSPTISDVLAVRMEPTAEEATSTEAPMDESQPQTPGDISGNYQLPSERQVQAREGTSGTVPFITDDSNLDDLQDSDEETSIVEPTKGSRFHRPPSPIPHRLNWSLHRSAPLTIPVPDTMLQFFFSSKPPAPKWAPPTLYFPGGRIVNSVDPDYRFFDEVALFQPCPRPSAYARKTPLPRDNSQDARGLIPPKPKEKRKLSIYDFIDKISRVGKVVDPQIAINAKSVEDFVKAYYIVGPNGEPLLNNPPKGAIPQVKIQHEWIPTSIVERHRIERVIRLLDLEISPATRAALFWILIERQTERTRVLLKYLAEYPEPKLKDVETKLISWGYLPGKDQTMEDRIAIEHAPMDSKDVIKSEVVEETQWLLDALGEAAGHQKTRKFLAPFMADYSIRNMGFFGLMGSDKMIELVEGLCNCLQMGENGSNLPSFPIQMGCWSLLNDLRPSAFVARSTSLCDLEYLYVVTQRAEVQPELLEVVARVMAPILKHISEHDDIPLRREIPEEVMRSLEQTGNAQIARYLEAQLPPAMPTTLELAVPKRARIESYEEEQARLEAIKLKERQEVMRARVRYMKEGIPCDLAVHPAEIYSPSRRRRKLLEGKARISRSSKRRAGITRTLGDEEEREPLGEAAIAPTNIKPRVTRKRGREETPGPSEVSSPGDVTSTRPRSKRVRFALNLPTVEEPLQPVPHKPSRNTRESDSDASDPPSEGDGSDWDRGGRKSRPAAVRKAILMADHDDQSGKSEDEGPQTRASTSVSKKGMKKSATTGKAKAAQIPSDISKPIEASATRALSPVYGTPQGDLAAPSWILPNLDNGSGEADEGHPRGGSARAQKEVKKRGGISGEDKTPKSLSTKSRPGVHTPLESPVMEPLQKPSRKQHNKRGYESDSSSSDEGDNDDAYDPPQTHRNKKSKVSKRAKHKGSRKIKIKTEKEAPPAGVRAGTVKAKTGPKGRQPRLPIQRDESDISDEGEDDKPRSPLPKVSVPGNESDISDEGDTPKPTSIVALPGPHTPPLLPVPQPPLRRSPRKHHPKRTYESDSSSSDKDDSGDCYVPRASRSTKRTRASEGVGKQDLGQNAPKAEKPQRPPPTQCIKTEPVAKAVAKKAGARSAAAKKADARSAAAKKAAATRAANHQALVDKITAELEAEAQRAADAGGYQPGAVTKTQLKSRMKREKENIKQEETRERLEAAASRREQSAEAKQIAAAEKRAAAAEKRAATIAAKKVAISEKIQSRSQRTVETKTANANIRDGGGTARGRVAKVKVERAAAESASGRNEENQASTPETVLEGQNVDHGESSRAGEQDAEESDYGAAKKGKRRKRNPKK